MGEKQRDFKEIKPLTMIDGYLSAIESFNEQPNQPTMSKMPKEIHGQIEMEAKKYGIGEGPILERMITEGMTTFNDLQNSCEVDFEAGAEFGYSLSLARIGELEKEVEFWKQKIANIIIEEENENQEP